MSTPNLVGPASRPSLPNHFFSHSRVILCVVLTLALITLHARAQPHAGMGLGADTPPSGPAISAKPSESFVKAVDLSPLAKISVHHQGRLKSFRSYAHEWIGYIAGAKGIGGLPDEFAYFDLLINSVRYDDADILYIKPKEMRARIIEELQKRTGPAAVPPERLARFMKTGQISQSVIRAPDIAPLIERWRRDLIKTAKFINQIEGGIGARDPKVLSSELRCVPPPGGDDKTPWFSTDELFAGGILTQPADPASGFNPDPKLVSEARNEWIRLVNAWRAEDAPVVNESLAKFCDLLPRFNPAVFPNQSRLAWETWYFNSNNLTWVWLIYLASIVFLLMAVVYRWNSARVIGMGIFFLAFGFHTFALGLRWYVSGRWPNSNMFEAVTTSVWFGACIAIVFEYIARRSLMRNLFALTAAVGSMCAMMAAHYLPQLNPSINNMMPVLHDIWLYIHTNVIIASYALIFMASVTATLYMVWRLFAGKQGVSAYARVGGTAALLDAISGSANAAMSAVLARDRALSTDLGTLSNAAALGSPASTPRSSSPAAAVKTSLGEVLDGATMILMELSFVMLWAGLVMGAIWADHSWGRPWGWDPKEVFALNTFIVFLVLVHIRLKVRDKGLWTALLAIVGCGVMLFNWIVINFVISGLHSYA